MTKIKSSTLSLVKKTGIFKNVTCQCSSTSHKDLFRNGKLALLVMIVKVSIELKSANVIMQKEDR